MSTRLDAAPYPARVDDADVGPNVIGVIERAHADLLAELRCVRHVPLARDRAARFERVARRMSQHGFAEEVAVYSVLARSGAPMPQELLVAGERELMAGILLALRWARWWPFARRPLRVVERLAASHFARDEAIALPLLRNSQDEAKLQMMGAWYARAVRLAPTRPHPRAPRMAWALLCTGPALAVTDRMRGRVRRAVGV